jgi:hypothetical protein
MTGQSILFVEFVCCQNRRRVSFRNFIFPLQSATREEWEPTDQKFLKARQGKARRCDAPSQDSKVLSKLACHPSWMDGPAIHHGWMDGCLEARKYLSDIGTVGNSIMLRHYDFIARTERMEECIICVRLEDQWQPLPQCQTSGRL